MMTSTYVLRAKAYYFFTHVYIVGERLGQRRHRNAGPEPRTPLDAISSNNDYHSCTRDKNGP